MDTKNIERANGKVTFDVVVDAAAFEAAVNAAYLKAKSRLSVPGFRRGKVSRQVVEGMYGKDVFYDDAVDSLALEAFRTGSKETGERTVGDPQITDYHVDDDKCLTISFSSALYPEVTLGEYKGLEAYKPPVEITDAEIDRELEAVRKRNARMVAVDREARDGDTVNIDYDGYKDGKRFAGGKAEGHNLVLGSGSFVPGFEDQIIGMKAGETRDLDITFPEDYAPDLAGAAVVFKVRVNDIQETLLPDLDDEFAKDVSEFDTLQEYKDSIRKDLTEQRERSAEDSFQSALIRKAAKNMTVEIPEPMLRRRVDDQMESFARRVRSQGFSLAQYLNMMGMNEQSYRQMLRISAESELRSELLLEAVANAEGVEITPEEIEAEYADAAPRYEMTLEEFKENVPADAIESELKLRRARDIIAAAGIATDKPETENAGEAAEEAAEAAVEAAVEAPVEAAVEAAAEAQAEAPAEAVPEAPAEAAAEAPAKPARKRAPRKKKTEPAPEAAPENAEAPQE